MGHFCPPGFRIRILNPDWIRIQFRIRNTAWYHVFFRKGWAWACARCTWTSGRSLRCCACTWRRAVLSAATTYRTGATSSAAASGSATIPASSSVARSHRSSARFSHRAFTSSGRTGHLFGSVIISYGSGSTGIRKCKLRIRIHLDILWSLKLWNHRYLYFGTLTFRYLCCCKIIKEKQKSCYIFSFCTVSLW